MNEVLYLSFRLVICDRWGFESGEGGKKREGEGKEVGAGEELNTYLGN